jgi:hypothetical protein
MNEHESLNHLLASSPPPGQFVNQAMPAPCQPASDNPVRDLDLCQWQVCANGTFRPAAKTVPGLPAGAYIVRADMLGPYLEARPIMSDDIVELPETANSRVLGVIRKFWGSGDRYRDHGLVFKRGVLLWGPPGSGKTVTVHLLVKDLIAGGGIVLFSGQPDLTQVMLNAIRKIERARPLILILEDIDEIVSRYGEHEILAMLDGESQTDNVVYLATTNYPERLGARIINRPSRFDDRIFVGMPSQVARLAYLRKATTNGSPMDDATVQKWAKETDGLSVAHLRELVAAVLCLDQEYDDVLARLRSMSERPREADGFTRNKLGLA